MDFNILPTELPCTVEIVVLQEENVRGNMILSFQHHFHILLDLFENVVNAGSTIIVMIPY